jgi:RND family efflux transporter MFP subunit
MNTQMLLALLLGLLMGLSTGCNRGPHSLGQMERPPQKVAVVAAQESQVEDFVELVGRTAALESVNVQSRVSGFLLKTHFVDGQQVRAGDLLFSIEPDQYQAIYNQTLAQVEVAKSQLDLAQKTFVRSQELIKTTAISREEFDQDQSAVAQAQAMVTAAEADAAKVKLDLDYTQISSPISGRVDRALLDEGNFVNGGLLGGTLLTTVVSDGQATAVANVDESVRLKVMRRQRTVAGADFKEVDKVADLKIPCYLQLQDETDYPHVGVVDYVEVKVDQQTGTSRIRGIFANEEGLLKPGMFVRLKIPVSDPYTAVLVPDTAIGTDQATKFVYVVNGNKEVEQRQVDVGDRKNKMRIIKSGVSAGESVVVAGMQLIQPGMKVEPSLKAE